MLRLHRLQRSRLPLYIIILFLLALLLYHIAARFFLNMSLPLREIIFTILAAAAAVISVQIFRIRAGRIFRTESLAVTREMEFMDLIRNHGSEIILLLDNLGCIVNHNRGLCRALRMERDSITGKPLREIFDLPELEADRAASIHYKQVILDKLKSAFLGLESELFMTIYARTLKETRTINLKLTPIMENRALKYIFVSGRLLHSDYITNRWLEREEADYEIENEISMVHIFSHRLTRNLEGRLSNSGILLIQIALQEAIMNAIEHGSFGIDFEAKTRLRRQDENYYDLLISSHDSEKHHKKIHIIYRLEKDRLYYRITDSGRGFDWRPYMNRESSSFGRDLMRNYHGVGLQMIRKAFDEISFNDEGNEITLVKFLWRDAGDDNE